MDTAAKALELINFEHLKNDGDEGLKRAKKLVKEWAMTNWDFTKYRTDFCSQIDRHRTVAAIEKHAWNAALKGVNIKQRIRMI